LARIFIDTGANCNKITRQFYSTLVGQGLKCAFYPGPSGGIEINLVVLGVSGDKTMFMTEVKTTWGTFHSEQEFLILDQDGEDLVMGVIWYNSIMTAKRDQITGIVDIRGFGIPEQVPIEFSQDIAPEDDLLGNSDLGVFPVGIMHF